MKRGLSIGLRLILVSTLLLIVVIGVFGVISGLQTRRIIDDSSKRLQGAITESLERAGRGQLQLLGQATLFALLQNDFTTLQSMVSSIAKSDQRLTLITVVDPQGTILAHGDKKLVNTKAKGVVKKHMATKKLDKAKVSFTHKGKKKPSLLFFSPVSHETKRMCTVFLAYSLEHLNSQLAKAARLKKSETRRVLTNAVLVGGLSVLLGVLLTVLQSLRITRPIQALARQANQIAGGDLHARVKISRRDEVGVLGDRFNYMADQVVLLMQETIEKASMEKELEVASAIQATLVPGDEVFRLSGCELAGYFKPAAQCGGDWWCFYELDASRTLVIVGDVTGHGVAPAMITAAAKGAAATIVEITKGKLTLKELMQAMNVAIHESARGSFVMTCFASIYDTTTRELIFANAGHNFPYLVKKTGGRPVPLVVRGNRLGELTEWDFEQKSIEIASEDVVIWYTDGIVECEDERGEEYGERRFRGLLTSYSQLGVGEARDQIVSQAMTFCGDVPPKDDITLIIGKFA